MSSDMTVDECFDILDTLLGTDGYIAITEAVKKLKADKDKYFGYLKDKDLECEEQRETAELLRQEISNYHEAQRYLMPTCCVPNDLAFEAKLIELKAENRDLKAENKELKADDIYQHKIIQKYNDENTMFICQVNRLEEEIKLLKEQIVGLEKS